MNNDYSLNYNHYIIMPEQPEVARITDQLEFYLINKKVLSITPLRGKFIEEFEKYDNEEDEEFEEITDKQRFLKDLPLKISDVFYRGKLIFIMFEKKGKKWMMVNSLRMTGSWRLDRDKYSCLKFDLEEKKENGPFDITEIYYTDVRTLGVFELIDDEDRFENRINDFNLSFMGRYTITYDQFEKNVKKCKNSFLVKSLDDQRSICSGIGNYLMSEILYDAKLHPLIKCNQLTNKNIKTLYNSCASIIKKSYENGGVSVSDYVDLYGEKGKHQDILKVYDPKKKKKTDPHGNKIILEKGKHGRTLYYIPGLQRLPTDTDPKEEDDELEIIINDE